MGEASPPREHILIAVQQDIPKPVELWVRGKFAGSEVTLYNSKAGKVPPELYHNATILVTFSDVPAIEDSRNLKLIHTLSAGLDHLVNSPVLKQTEIPFTTSSGIHGPPISEWVLMNWLVAARHYGVIHEAQKAHKWEKDFPWMQKSSDQVGKKVGILGYGSIGRQIARVSQAMGMTVHAYTASPRPTPESRHDNTYIVPGTGDPDGIIPVSWHHGTGKESIHEFLSIGLDQLVVSVPLTPDTTHLLGSEEFEILSKNSKNPLQKPYVTNISRGKVINQDALIEALKSGLLSGAALDVTDPEPLPSDHPLWDVPNVQISPHISGAGKEYLPRSFDIVNINLDRIKEGLPLINEYKRGTGY